jgi:hypothetical protein
VGLTVTYNGAGATGFNDREIVRGEVICYKQTELTKERRPHEFIKEAILIVILVKKRENTRIREEKRR